MNPKVILTTIVFFFLFQSLWAQDTVKHAVKSSKHIIKHTSAANTNDSVKKAIAKKESLARDSVKSHKKEFVKVPKYKRDGYVAIMGGLGLPAGTFASSGFASTGSVFSICAGFPGIISHSGFAFKFDAGTNSLNKSQYINSLNNQIGIQDLSYSFTGALEKFSYHTILTGLYLTYPAKHLTIDVRILGGVMMATYPSFEINILNSANGVNGTFYQSETKGDAFAFDFGMDARYLVIKNISIIFSADYLHAVPSFPNVESGIPTSLTGGVIPNEEFGTTNMPYNLFNLSLGVGYTITALKPESPKTN
jgi:hypothetical protein